MLQSALGRKYSGHENCINAVKITKPFETIRQIRLGAREGRAVRRDGRGAGGTPADAQLRQQAGGWRRVQGERKYTCQGSCYVDSEMLLIFITI